MLLELNADKERYARSRHARFIRPTTVYHVISRTNDGMFLMRPDLEGELRRIVAGILSRAKENYPNIANYGTTLLSNHGHKVLSPKDGDPRHMSDYIGYVKRELARRWPRQFGYDGTVWKTYLHSAIITPERQIETLKYVLAQGVKENLVEHPFDWPGFHCAESLASGEAMEGYWLSYTDLGRELDRNNRRKKKKAVCEDDYKEARSFSFDRLPILADMSDSEHRLFIENLIDEIVEERKAEYGTKPALGAERICTADIRDRSPIPDPPWFEDRKRLIVWDDPSDPEVREYLDEYWEFQRTFRDASKHWKQAQPKVEVRFPQLSFVPGYRPRPISHMEQSSG